jgi:DNA-binding CsgD family transcriptional regulator
MLTGMTHEAMRWSAEAAELLRRENHLGPLRWSLSYLALAAAMSGDGRTAGEALSELDVAAMHPSQMLDIETMRARAWKAICDARPEEAKVILVAAAKEMNASAQVSFEASALYDLARLGHAEEVAERLTEIGAIGQSEMHRTMGAAAHALAHGTAAEIAAESDTFASMGVNLFAAELAVSASDAFRREGDQRRVAEWGRRASELTALCEGAQTPGLVQIDAPIPLTQREREIALLAAQGLTSKTIGERLYVASRTVDNHLARIYSKLGVSNRNELSSALSMFE